MKNSKDLTGISPIAELLAQKEGGQGPHSLFPLDHLAFAIMLDSGYAVPEALGVIGELHKEFVDWNEIRVARSQEIVRALGGGEKAERAAQRLKEDYNAFFENKGALNFDFLAVGKPAEMRRALAQLLPHLGKGAVSLLLFEFCPGAPLPLSEEGLKKAKKDGVLGKNGDRGQLSRALVEEIGLDRSCLLLQYWELEAWGTPYGEFGRKELAGAKKMKKTPSKEKAAPAPKNI